MVMTQQSHIDWEIDSLCADESLDEPPRKRPTNDDTRSSVSKRIEVISAALKLLNNQDDSLEIDRLSGLSLAHLTGQIREIERNALQLAREEGREEFRVKALLHNLSFKGLLESMSTASSSKWTEDCSTPYIQRISHVRNAPIPQSSTALRSPPKGKSQAVLSSNPT